MNAQLADTRLIDFTDALLLDLDGTVYNGAEPIASAVDALSRARQLSRCVYVTNNASRGPDVVANTLNSMGVQCTESDILTSAQAGVALLAEKIPAGSPVYVLGTESLKQLVRAAGFTVAVSAEDNPAGVIHGHNPETGWAELSEACLAIRRGAHYVATNRDATLPSERGMLVGNGSMVAALINATGITPESAGKPAGTMFYQAAQSVESSRPLGVGDRLDTDIAGGNAAGMSTLMVMTGVSGHRDLLAAPPQLRPTFIGETLSCLFEPPVYSQPGPKPGWKIQLTADGTLTINSVPVDPDMELSPAQESPRAHDCLLAALAAAWSDGAPAITRVSAGDDHAQEVIDSWR